MTLIENRDSLLDNSGTPGDRRARSLVLDGLEAALEASDPASAVRSHVKVSEATLQIDGFTLNLAESRRIIVIGGGKAGGAMAEALESILGDYVTEGVVNVLEGTAARFRTRRVRLNEASHPIPNENGMLGVRRMLDLIGGADPRDIIICLISGGGSALMPLPRGDVSLSDKQSITKALLRSGATINELNAVRKHLSDFKGGMLAKKAFPATVISLILSDVVGDPLDVIASGPTVPDSSRFSDAVAILKRYNLWDTAPPTIRGILDRGKSGGIEENPKHGDLIFNNVHNAIIGSNRIACFAAQKKLKERKVNAVFLTSFLEGEARDAGIFLASIAREISTSDNPVSKPAGVILGGETTVTVRGSGRGGRNQEVMLSAAMKIQGIEGVALSSMGSDGVDGPTEAAGAIIDGKTASRGQARGMKLSEYLENNDSNAFFKDLSDLILTGPTGTNVNDVAIIVAV